jgi:hypothetical protein
MLLKDGSFAMATNESGPNPLLVPKSGIVRCDAAERKQNRASREKLAATQVMAEMRYNDPKLLSLLGGSGMWLEKLFEESPSASSWMKENVRKTTRGHIIRVLSKRFHSVPDDLVAWLNTINDQEKLESLHDIGLECVDLEAFRVAMSKPT